MKNNSEQYYIVRCDRAGVFYGQVKYHTGREVCMTNVRRIWYWNGAATLSQLAMEGVKNPRDCKFTMAANEIVLLDAIEIIPCTAEAKASVDGVSVWKL